MNKFHNENYYREHFIGLQSTMDMIVEDVFKDVKPPNYYFVFGLKKMFVD